jgi:integrase
VRDRDGRVREVTATAATKGAALRALDRKLLDRSPTAPTGVRATMTLDELAEFWMEHKRRHGLARRRGPIKPQTLASYQSAHRTVISPALGAVRVGEVSVGLLDSVLGDLEASGISTAQARSVLSQMLTLAVRHEALAQNPVPLVPRAAREQREVEALDLAGVRRLRRLVDPDVRRKPGRRGPNRDLAEFVDVALGTGCRAGEVLALKWKHLDFTGATPIATISGTLVEPRAGFVERLDRQESTKSGRTRRLVLPDHVVAVLHSRREAIRYDDPDDPVFASRNGTWLWPNNLRTRLRAAVVGSALAGTTPHTLRRTVGTLVAHEAGLDAARWQLGHSDPSVTWQAYVAGRPIAPDLRHLLDQFFTNEEEK